MVAEHPRSRECRTPQTLRKSNAAEIKIKQSASCSNFIQDPLPPGTTVNLLVARFVVCHRTFVTDFN